MTNRQAGFTLIEALVALLLMAGVFAALHQGLALGWRGIAASEQERLALQIARRELARVGNTSSLTAGSRSEATEGQMSWSVVVQPADGGGSELQGGFSGRTLTPVSAYWVRVEVRWRDWHGPRRLRLQTVKLGS